MYGDEDDDEEEEEDEAEKTRGAEFGARPLLR